MNELRIAQERGAAAMLWYLQKLFVNSPRQSFGRDDILGILITTANDRDIFPLDMANEMIVEDLEEMAQQSV